MSLQPMHVQIRNWLVARIDAGELPEGSRLPSEHELAAQFGVSRPTVRQAVLEMARQGFVSRVRGQGTTVLGRRREYPIRRLISFTEEHAGSDRVVTSEVLSSELVLAGERFASLFDVSEDRQVFSLSRLRGVDGKLAAWQQSYIPIRYVPGIEQIDFSDESLYRVIAERYSLEVNHGDEVINVGGATRKEAGLLQIRVGEPVFRIDRRSYLTSGRLLELVESVYCGGQYSVRLRLAR